MLNLKSILDELTQSSDSILATGVLSSAGVTLSQTANPSQAGLKIADYAYPLMEATADYGNRLSTQSQQGELDWMLLTKDDSQILISQSGPDTFLCGLLSLDSEIDGIVQSFKNAAEKIKSLLD